MGTFDIVLIILFFGFVGAGFYFGLIHTLGAIIGVVVGAIAAGNLYTVVSPFFEFFFLKPNVANVIAFIVVFLVVSRLVGWMVHMFDQGFKLIKLIPFASSINRLGGALLGFIEASLVLGTILFVVSNAQISPEIRTAIEGSPFAGLLITLAKVVVPLLPDALRTKLPFD